MVAKYFLLALDTSVVVRLSSVIDVSKTILALHVEAALTRRVSKSSSEVLVADGAGKMDVRLIRGTYCTTRTNAVDICI
jgi:hypothetical protein